MTLLDRKVELVIQREGESFQVRNLMMDFRVQKFSNALVDNRATIRVFNLRDSVRSFLNRRRLDLKEKPYTSVFLSAGYEGAVAMIFRGVVINGANARVGPDWVTEFESFTAKAQVDSAVCDPEAHTWIETPPKTIIDTLFEALGTNAARYSSEATEVLSGATPMTIACTGRLDQAIEKILSRHELVFTIEDDGPFVVVVNGASNPNEPSSSVPVVSAETGLVGTPKITHSGVEIRSLLNPNLKIFQRFKLTSLTTDGSLELADREFTITNLEHFGSNRGEEFFTEAVGQFYPRVPFEATPVEPTAAFTSDPVVVGGA